MRRFPTVRGESEELLELMVPFLIPPQDVHERLTGVWSFTNDHFQQEAHLLFLLLLCYLLMFICT